MAEAGGWGVVVHDDDLNTEHAVAYVVHTACGLPMPAAFDAVAMAKRHGSVRLVGWPERAQAELAVARLQILGLHATIAAG